MSLRIKAVVDKFVKELKEALDADIQDRIMKEREMQCYIEEREREVAEREAAWKAQLSRRAILLKINMWRMWAGAVVGEENGLKKIPTHTLLALKDVVIKFAEIARQEARLKMERENLEKEKSVLMGTASSQDNQDGALEITESPQSLSEALKARSDTL
nr:beta-mannosyltransferase-like protein [Ipomoea batatas]